MNIPERYVTAPGPYPPARLKPARGADRPISKSNPPKRPDYYVHIIPYSLRISECRPGFTAHPARRGANSAVERPTLQQHRRNNNCSAPTGRRQTCSTRSSTSRRSAGSSALARARQRSAASPSPWGHKQIGFKWPHQGRKSAERVRILGCKKRGRPSDKPMATGEGWVAPRSKGHSVSRHAGCRYPVNQASLTRFALRLPSYATIATPSSRSRSPYTSPLYESFYSAFALRFDLQGLHSLCKCLTLTDDYICQRLHGGSFWFYTPRGRG